MKRPYIVKAEIEYLLKDNNSSHRPIQEFEKQGLKENALIDQIKAIDSNLKQ